MNRIESRVCEYDHARRRLSVASECFGGGFPQEVVVISSRTRREVRFVQDRDAAIRNEGWDGEEMHYIAVDNNLGPLTLVVYHAF